jgi:hypothetical protein
VRRDVARPDDLVFRCACQIVIQEYSRSLRLAA